MKNLFYLSFVLLISTNCASNDRLKRYVRNLTVQQKLGQVTQPDIRWIKPAEVTKYNIGSILKGGGLLNDDADNGGLKGNGPDAWTKMVQTYKLAALKSETKIPLIFAIDAVHGHNNVTGATLFPHNIGLGATRDLDVVKKIGEITAWEVFITGIDWNFAPTVAVARNENWGRTYESFSEKTDFVTRYATAYLKGLQTELPGGFRIIGTAKHWIGDGGTTKGIDQGNTQLSEEELRKMHLAPYLSLMKNGVQTVMVSFNSWNGVKLHGHKYLIQEVLRDELGFDGVVVTDWNGIDQIKTPGGLNPDQKYMYQIAKAFDAGIDVFMVPENWKKFINLSQVLLKNHANGVKPSLNPKRLDEAVYRLLRLKKIAKIGKKPLPLTVYNKYKARFGSKEHKKVAYVAAKKSAVLLKKESDFITAEDSVLVVGEMAKNTGYQAGGWSLAWQGVTYNIPGSESIYSGIKAKAQKVGFKIGYSKTGNSRLKPTKVIVVIGEKPYAEGKGDMPETTGPVFHPSQVNLLKKALTFGVPVTAILLNGRPMLFPKELDKVDNIISYWLPGTMGSAIADLLLGEKFTGKLPFSWPANKSQVDFDYRSKNVNWKYPLGFGL